MNDANNSHNDSHHNGENRGEPPSRWDQFLDENSSAMSFIGIAALVFALLQMAYFQWFVGSAPFYAYLEFCANASAGLLNLLGEEVGVFQRTLTNHSGPSVTVVEGCDALRIFSVLVAAMVAFEASVREKISGIVISVSILFVLNLFRISALLWIDTYYSEWFDLFHYNLLPLTLWAAAMWLFFDWGRRVTAPSPVDDGGNSGDGTAVS